MNKLFILSVFAFLFAFTHPVLGSEGDRFSNNRSTFIEELEIFLNVKDNKEMALLMGQLEAKLNGGQFSEATFVKMVNLCNRMFELDMKARPYFTEYIESVCSWKGSCTTNCQLENWHDVYEQLLDQLEGKSFEAYAELLKFAQQFYEKGALYYKKSGTSWTVEQNKHEIIWQDNQPVIVVKDTRLQAAWKDNTMTIESTSGQYFPFKDSWEGNGGKVNWNMLAPDAGIEAELVEYNVNVTKKEYTAKEALLTHPGFFGDIQVRGKFSDKLLSSRTSSKSSYPRFASTGAAVEIIDVFSNVNYRGGFSLSGLKAEGIATSESKATLVIFDKNKKQLATLQGDLISLERKQAISAKSMSVEIALGNEGSLSHPCVNVKYEPGQKMTFRSNEKSASKSPYYNSYHKVFIFANSVEFDTQSGDLHVNPKKGAMGGNGQRVRVESESFYDKNRYNRIQNVATIHPLAVIAKVAKEEGRTFSAETLAPKINPNFNVESIQRLLFDLEQDGFLLFNFAKKEVTVLDRTFHYVDAAAGKQDSDLMRFESDSEKTNAVISTSDKTIEMEGVKNFMLHPRPRVAAVPKGGNVTLKKDRGAAFEGRVFAGFGVIEGAGFDFDYAKFQMEAKQVNTFDLYIPDGGVDKSGQPTGKSIGSRIENTSGILLVNAPENKSGKELIKMFPSFVTKTASYIFYDQRNQQGENVYGREDFYFELKPFTFNSLSNVTPNLLTFAGKMVSAGIFPEFAETVVFQEHDQSLGFTRATPAEGFDIYQKGNYQGDISLSNAGFKGIGELSWLATNFKAENFLFKPNQTSANAEVFDLAGEVADDVPTTHGEDVHINWLPYADSMFIESKVKSFDLFEKGTHKVDGLLIYTPDGLKARGQFDWEDGTMDSELFSLGHHSIQTGAADLKIKSMSTTGVALNTNNLRGNIDFEQQKGEFFANNTHEETKMPANQYKTSLNSFEWDLAAKTLKFKAPENDKGWFLSTDNAQDSLFFKGATATYDFENTELNVTDVSEIEVADALIIPHKGQVKIESGGLMQQLEKAHIIANSTTRYHQIIDATIQVKGREEFTGKGFYEYKVEGKPQLIELKRIIGKGTPGGEKTFTAAEAEITEADGFYLDANTRYMGEVSLKSTEQWLEFNGFSQMQISVLNKNEWFETAFKGDYKNLLIAADEPKNREGQTLKTGLFVDFENAWNYTSVLMPERSKRDRELFSATGVVRYDVAADGYQFGPARRLDNPLTPGNLLTFNSKDASVKAEGSFDLCPNMKELGFHVAGFAKAGLGADALADPTMANDKIEAEFIAGFDFNLPKNLMKIMQTDFASASFDAQPVVYGKSTLYRTAITEWTTDEKVRNASWSGLMARHVLDLGNSTPRTFVLGEMQMVWNSELQSFATTSGKVALNSMNGQGIHRYVETLAEFHMPSNKDDRIYLMLKSHSGKYYYFNYKKGILHVYSNNEEFNQEVESMKDGERKIEAIKGQPYELQLTTPDIVNFFLRRHNR